MIVSKSYDTSLACILTKVVCVAVVIPLTLMIESNFSSASRCSIDKVRLAEFAGDTLEIKCELITDSQLNCSVYIPEGQSNGF